MPHVVGRPGSVTFSADWHGSSALSGTDHQRAPGSFHHVVNHGAQAVDFQNALDLDEQTLDQAETAACDPHDRGGRMSVGEVA